MNVDYSARILKKPRDFSRGFFFEKGEVFFSRDTTGTVFGGCSALPYLERRAHSGLSLSLPYRVRNCFSRDLVPCYPYRHLRRRRKKGGLLRRPPLLSLVTCRFFVILHIFLHFFL